VPKKGQKPTEAQRAALAKGRKSFTKGDERLKTRRKPRKTALSGRPPKDWRDYWRSAVNRAEVLEAADAILADPSHKQYAQFLAWATEQAYGKQAEKLEVGGSLEIVIRDESRGR
jgi:hypothetical protein